MPGVWGRPAYCEFDLFYDAVRFMSFEIIFSSNFYINFVLECRYLAAAGVGHVGIVDADTVDTSNLQRQVIHSVSTVGMSKCESAQRRIHDINPHVKVRLYEEEFTSETAERILGGGFEDSRPYDVVVDGSDNFPTKYLINDVCELVGTPWVYSAILAFEGQLSVFNFEGGPNYRDMLPTPPPPGDVPVRMKF